MPLLLLFVVMPVVEMWLLIEVGSKIGALTTIALVLLTAMIGLKLLRQQGVSTLTRANQRMQSGQLPAQEMVEGLFLAVGGALLLTPGFITDGIGFICLIPGLRQLLIGRLVRRLILRGTVGGAFYGQGPFDDGTQDRASSQKRAYTEGRRQSGSGDVIEGEYRVDGERHRESIDDRPPK